MPNYVRIHKDLRGRDQTRLDTYKAPSRVYRFGPAASAGGPSVSTSIGRWQTPQRIAFSLRRVPTPQSEAPLPPLNMNQLSVVHVHVAGSLNFRD